MGGGEGTKKHIFVLIIWPFTGYIGTTTEYIIDRVSVHFSIASQAHDIIYTLFVGG